MQILVLAGLLVAVVARDAPNEAVLANGLTIAERKNAIDQAAQKADRAAELAMAEAKQEEDEEKNIEASVKESAGLDLSDIEEAGADSPHQQLSQKAPLEELTKEARSDRTHSQLKEGAKERLKQAMEAKLKEKAEAEQRSNAIKAAKLAVLEHEKAAKLVALEHEKEEVRKKIAELERRKAEEEVQLRKAESLKKMTEVSNLDRFVHKAVLKKYGDRFPADALEEAEARMKHLVEARLKQRREPKIRKEADAPKQDLHDWVQKTSEEEVKESFERAAEAHLRKAFEKRLHEKIAQEEKAEAVNAPAVNTKVLVNVEKRKFRKEDVAGKEAQTKGNSQKVEESRQEVAKDNSQVREDGAQKASTGDSVVVADQQQDVSADNSQTSQEAKQDASTDSSKIRQDANQDASTDDSKQADDEQGTVSSSEEADDSQQEVGKDDANDDSQSVDESQQEDIKDDSQTADQSQLDDTKHDSQDADAHDEEAEVSESGGDEGKDAADADGESTEAESAEGSSAENSEEAAESDDVDAKASKDDGDEEAVHEESAQDHEEDSTDASSDEQDAEVFLQRGKARQPLMFSTEDADLQPYLHPRRARRHALVAKGKGKRYRSLRHKHAAQQFEYAAPSPGTAAAPAPGPAPSPALDPEKMCDELCKFDTGMDGDPDMCRVDCRTYVDAGGDLESLKDFVTDETYNEQGGEKMEQHFEQKTGEDIPDCTPTLDLDPNIDFKVVDANGDGKLTKDEVDLWGEKACVPNELAQQIFIAADVDCNDVVSQAEYNAIGEDTEMEDSIDKLADKTTEGEDQYEPVQMPAFKHVDSNSDGQLDKDEIMNIFKQEIKRRIPTMGEEEINALALRHQQELLKDVENVDKNADGLISEEEYKAGHIEGMGRELSEAAAADNNLPDPDDLKREPQAAAAAGGSPAASPAPAAAFLARES